MTHLDLLGATSFTSGQLITVIVLSVLLLGMLVASAAVFYMTNKLRHRRMAEKELTLRVHNKALRSHNEMLRARNTDLKEKGETMTLQLAKIGNSGFAGRTFRFSASGTNPEDGDDEENVMHYNRSFTAKLIQSSDENKEIYADFKNELLSYEGVTSSISWKWESFRYKRKTVAKLAIRGKTMCVYMPVDPATVTKFKVDDVSDVASMQSTPALARMRSDRARQNIIAVLQQVLADYGSKKKEREAVDYYLPYSGTLALIRKGLIKRVIRKSRPITFRDKKKTSDEVAAAKTPSKEPPASEGKEPAAQGAENGEQVKTEPKSEAEAKAENTASDEAASEGKEPAIQSAGNGEQVKTEPKSEVEAKAENTASGEAASEGKGPAAQGAENGEQVKTEPKSEVEAKAENTASGEAAGEGKEPAAQSTGKEEQKEVVVPTKAYGTSKKKKGKKK